MMPAHTGDEALTGQALVAPGTAVKRALAMPWMSAATVMTEVPDSNAPPLTATYVTGMPGLTRVARGIVPPGGTAKAEPPTTAIASTSAAGCAGSRRRPMSAKSR